MHLRIPPAFAGGPLNRAATHKKQCWSCECTARVRWAIATFRKVRSPTMSSLMRIQYLSLPTATEWPCGAICSTMAVAACDVPTLGGFGMYTSSSVYNILYCYNMLQLLPPSHSKYPPKTSGWSTSLKLEGIVDHAFNAGAASLLLSKRGISWGSLALRDCGQQPPEPPFMQETELVIRLVTCT